MTRKEIKARLAELGYAGKFRLRTMMNPFTGNKVPTVTLLECDRHMDFAAVKVGLKPGVVVVSFEGTEIVGSINGWPIFKKETR